MLTFKLPVIEASDVGVVVVVVVGVVVVEGVVVVVVAVVVVVVVVVVVGDNPGIEKNQLDAQN